MAFTFVQAHAIAMILAWMTFASTGILLSRYGRFLRLGNRRQLLGKAVWFQIHRFLLSLTSLCTLVGFFFILVRAGGSWVNLNTSDIRLFIHSVFGGIIVCGAIIQVWLALYRCNPRSRFRFIFDWSHRIVGLLSFSLVIPTIFLITIYMSKSRPKLLPIFSCWTVWIVLIIIIFEKIEYQQRKVTAPLEASNTQRDDANRANVNINLPPDIEAGTNVKVISRRLNLIKLLLLFVHIIISITLSILLIVFVCM